VLSTSLSVHSERFGFLLDEAFENELRDNSARSNRGQGSLFVQSPRNSVWANSSSDNGDAGFVLAADSSANRFNRNNARGNTLEGFATHDSGANSFTANTSTNNGVSNIGNANLIGCLVVNGSSANAFTTPRGATKCSTPLTAAATPGPTTTSERRTEFNSRLRCRGRFPLPAPNAYEPLPIPGASLFERVTEFRNAL
jgi:Right handed beta helix region